MDIIQLLLKEMEQEAQSTKKMLERIPDDQFDWKPHQKSMNVRQLATHIAELPSWVSMALATDELDFGKMDYQPTPIHSTKELLALHEKSLAEGKEALGKTNETELEKNWTLRTGEKIHSVSTKYEVIRMSFAQITHHRAQLGVFLRLLNIPIPGSYGPSADEMNF